LANTQITDQRTQGEFSNDYYNNNCYVWFLFMHSFFRFGFVLRRKTFGDCCKRIFCSKDDLPIMQSTIIRVVNGYFPSEYFRQNGASEYALCGDTDRVTVNSQQLGYVTANTHHISRPTYLSTPATHWCVTNTDSMNVNLNKTLQRRYINYSSSMITYSMDGGDQSTSSYDMRLRRTNKTQSLTTECL